MADDPSTSKLVTELAGKLADHHRVPDEVKREGDGWQVDAVASGALRSNLRILEGFVGAKGGVAGREWQVLYLDIAMQRWLCIESTGIVHSATVEDKTVPGREHDVLWVDADALVVEGGWPQTAEADWLTGPFTRAGDFDARPTGASTGIFGGLGTPYGCVRKSR